MTCLPSVTCIDNACFLFGRLKDVNRYARLHIFIRDEPKTMIAGEFYNRIHLFSDCTLRTDLPCSPWPGDRFTASRCRITFFLFLQKSLFSFDSAGALLKKYAYDPSLPQEGGIHHGEHSCNPRFTRVTINFVTFYPRAIFSPPLGKKQPSYSHSGRVSEPGLSQMSGKNSPDKKAHGSLWARCISLLFWQSGLYSGVFSTGTVKEGFARFSIRNRDTKK